MKNSSLTLLILLCFCFIMQISGNAVAADNTVNHPAIVFKNGSIYSVDLIDEDRKEGKVIIYTRNYGEYTKPFAAGTREFVVVNNLVAYENPNGIKGTYIPPDGYVISYTGNNSSFIDNLYTGEELTLLNLNIPVFPDMYFKLNGMVVPIDGVNSGRSERKIILYDPSYGASTKTNAWGMELTVVNNVITDIVDMKNDNGIWLDNNSSIPSNGVVISIHSESPYYSQLHEKVKVGDNVTIALDNIKPYSAGKALFDAYNPVSIEDNPAAWDEEEGKPYDGYRGANQLIVYDASYGSRTGTNPYGYEVVVGSEGKIIKTGGNDSEIPEGGYVLSGHGDKAKWLQKYARLGSTVVLNKDKKEIRIIFTPNSFVDMAEASIKSAQDSIDLAKRKFMDIDYDRVQKMIDTARSKLDRVRAQLNQGEYKELVKTVNDIQNDANMAYYMTFESPKVENRAVWVRPRETSIDEVKKHLDMLKDININTVYLETYWGGYCIYPSDNEIMRGNPIYGGFDVLDAYIKEAHARGMKLVAWVEDFLVAQNIAEEKPEWMIESRKGDRYFQSSSGIKYYFMNPALPEVRDFLSGLYKDLIKKYDLDGIQFDYMRYPNSGDYSNDFGYDPYTRQLFETYNGIDPITLNPGDVLWQTWCDFRVNIVNEFAYRIFSEMKSIKPDIQISADVWPGYDKSIMDTFQDPKSWTRQDYINTLIPMSYYLYEQPVVDDINNTRAFAKGHSLINVGISTSIGPDTKTLLRQVDAIRSSDTNGVAIFEFQSLFNGGYDGALMLGAFSAPAVAASGDPQQSINMVLKDIVRKIDDIYVKYGGMNDEQAEKYKKLVGGIYVDFKDAKDKAKRADHLKKSIEDLLNDIHIDRNLNQDVAARISTDLNTVVNIIDEYISNIRFMENHEVREFQAEIPMNALRREKEAPVKIKAIFDDASSAIMYLDSTQYEIKSSNSWVAAMDGDMLKIKGNRGKASITIDILDTFNFNAAKGTSKKIEFTINPRDEDMVASSAYGTLSATEVTDAEVKLDWSGAVTDACIAGYTVYRNGKKIAKVSTDTFCDVGLESDKIYVYKVYGFDASGKTVYRSNQKIVRTKVSKHNNR